MKQSRKSKGHTQESLARAIGVSRGVISNIEYEKTEPQPLVLHAVCSVLGIHENWLMKGEGQMDNNVDLGKSGRLLSEIYRCAKELSEEEQDYILDMIRTFQRHRENIADRKPE